ncbi:MAG: hypothetical protein R3F11_25045 [Verrucomicrobiales bacterium]
MSDVFATVFIILGIMLMLVGYWLTSQSLFPAMVEGTAERYRRSPVASVLVGILLLILFAVVSGVIGAIPNPALKLTSVGISALYLDDRAVRLGGDSPTAWVPGFPRKPTPPSGSGRCAAASS